MPRALRLPLVALALCATGLLLFGDSARKCNHAAQSVDYSASGTCGASGDITVKSPANSCDVDVSGASVGLPTTGELGDNFDLTQGGWQVDGTLMATTAPAPDGGVASDAGTADAGNAGSVDAGNADGGASDAGTAAIEVTRVCTTQANSDGSLTMDCNAGDPADEGACTETLVKR